MGVRNQVLGLRDRKKIQTRLSIRREAMRLIEENGYGNTTVEQITAQSVWAPPTAYTCGPDRAAVRVTRLLAGRVAAA